MDQSVIVLIVIVIIAFLLIHFVFSKCPKCGKSGAMVQVGKKEISRNDNIDLNDISSKKQGQTVVYEVTSRCKYCGYTKTHRTRKNEGKTS